MIRVDSTQLLQFENLGTNVQVIANGTTIFEGRNYALRQFHLHSPSEHHIEGEYFPLEMHLVLESIGIV